MLLERSDDLGQVERLRARLSAVRFASLRFVTIGFALIRCGSMCFISSWVGSPMCFSIRFVVSDRFDSLRLAQAVTPQLRTAQVVSVLSFYPSQH